MNCPFSISITDVRLRKFNEEKQALKQEIDQLHEKLIDSKTKGRSGSLNGPSGDDDYEDAQSNFIHHISNGDRFSYYYFFFFPGESNKVIADYKYKLTKAEQEIASLQANLARSESQVIRYKSTADATEKAEAELKIERRKLQREVNIRISKKSRLDYLKHLEDEKRHRQFVNDTHVQRH